MIQKANNFAIATATREATTAGATIANSGGNAVDVAIAAAFNLLVSDICMCSIGGGGYAIIRTPDGKVELIDFFDCMPGKGLDIDYYRKKIRPVKINLDYGSGHTIIAGHSSVAVPGAVKGLEFIQNKYGTMPLKEVLKPAIDDAKNGTIMTRNLYDCFVISAEKVHWRSEYSKSILSVNNTAVPPVGYRLKQTDLANTLELIAQQGSDVIYNGVIANELVNVIQEGGGLLTLEDLNTYQPIVRKPLKCNFNGKKIWANPPPSVGGATLVEILNILSHHKFSKKLTPYDINIISKAQQQAFKDKFTKYIDINTNEEVSKHLLSSEYALDFYKKIIPPPHTSHLSCIDDSGYAVGITMSMGYDSGVSIPGTGIFMANFLGEMDLNPKGFLQATPGDRIISGMTPTIMFDEKNNDLFVLGSAGSSRIISSLMHIILNLTVFKMDLISAVHKPRFHYEGNEFYLEPDIEIDNSLIDKNTIINQYSRIEQFFGGARCVRMKNNKLLEAVNDPRRSGSTQTLTR
ncbi:MAG: gamma-glutamyltransferase [Cyanobacteriota bacterium]